MGQQEKVMHEGAESMEECGVHLGQFTGLGHNINREGEGK